MADVTNNPEYGPERYPDSEPSNVSYAETEAPAAAAPTPRKIDMDTLKACLIKGLDDFRAEPGYGLTFGAVYVVGGLFLWWLSGAVGNSGVLIPLAFAFPLLGPFLAIGLYEVSRRRISGEPMERAAIFGAVFRQRDGQMPFMGVVILFLTLSWLILARVTFALFLGDDAMTNIFSTREALLTFDGVIFMAVAAVLGAAFAALVFSMTVVGMPLLLDREIDFVTATITSIQAVVENPKPMAAWAALVVVVLAVAMLPAFLGLLVALPILGHATWHLYMAVVE